MRRYVALILAVAIVWASGVQAGTAWTDITRRYQQTCAEGRWTRWTLCGLYYITQSQPAPSGGPQALEGYAVVQHRAGTVQLAIGTLGNIELAGAAGTETERAVALGGGLVVAGPGHVAHATSLSLNQPHKHSTYDGPMSIDRIDYVTFDNGWSIRPDGDNLLICDPRDHCRAF